MGYIENWTSDMFGTYNSPYKQGEKGDLITTPLYEMPLIYSCMGFKNAREAYEYREKVKLLTKSNLKKFCNSKTPLKPRKTRPYTRKDSTL